MGWDYVESRGANYYCFIWVQDNGTWVAKLSYDLLWLFASLIFLTQLGV
jgi:hypothetical protein